MTNVASKAPKPRPCAICESEYKTRVEGWILSGKRIQTIVEWCGQLEPPIPCSRDTVYDHIDQGHVAIGKTQVTGMLIKFNQEAQEVIDLALEGGDRMPKAALNVAMTIRMRTIEILAKAHDVIEQAPRSVKQELNVMLSKDTQRQMLEAAVRQLDKPNARIEGKTQAEVCLTPEGTAENEPGHESATDVPTAE